jgi:hypothetical protein
MDPNVRESRHSRWSVGRHEDCISNDEPKRSWRTAPQAGLKTRLYEMTWEGMSVAAGLWTADGFRA